MEYDNLIAGMTPPMKVASGIIRGIAAGATYARGTVMAKSSADGLLVILGSQAANGETLTADCVLCDDTPIKKDDKPAAVYVMGCINEKKLTVASGYQMTQADRDKLRERGIYLAEVWD
jgi:hypothetical protein